MAKGIPRIQKTKEEKELIYAKVSASKKGTVPWNKGAKGKQIAWNKGLKGYITGDKNPLWKGGISYFSYKEKIAGRERPEQCEICGAMGVICFDHDHKTGKFRGWICSRCNVVLGHVKDNSELLIALSKYLNVRSNNSDKQDSESTEESQSDTGGNISG